MRVIFTTLLIAFVAAQKLPEQAELDRIFGSAPGLEAATNPYKNQLLDIYGPPTSFETASDRVEQQLIEIFGGSSSTKPGSGVDVKQQVFEIFGGPPINTRGSEVDVKQEVIDIFGDLTNLEPIDELTLPPSIYLDIFGSDENEITEITETPENTSPFTKEASSLVSIPASTEITLVATRPEITSPSPVTPETSVTQTIEVNPTEASTTLVGNDGAPCKCLPYYLCDKDHNGIHYNNQSVTGTDLLDIRFGEDDNKPTRKCQETVELCCTIPRDPVTVPVVTEKPKLKGCGYRNPNGVDFTLTGGTGKEAQYGEFPWVVALIAPNGSLVGVGGIIHPQVIITGAHITKKLPEGSLKVRAGEWDTSTDKERLPYQEREIQETYTHHDFHPKSLRNDLALLRLTEPLKLDQHINMICLPEQDESFDTSVGCIANGWGKDVFGLKGRYAVILKKVEVNMVPYNRCSSLLKNTRLGPDFDLHKSFVCAGGEEGKDLCTGDGGGPLVCPLGNDRFKLSGLVAWGIGCGGKDIPAVYAGVSNFRSMIDAKMNEWGYGVSSYTV